MQQFFKIRFLHLLTLSIHAELIRFSSVLCGCSLDQDLVISNFGGRSHFWSGKKYCIFYLALTAGHLTLVASKSCFWMLTKHRSPIFLLSWPLELISALVLNMFSLPCVQSPAADIISLVCWIDLSMSFHLFPFSSSSDAFFAFQDPVWPVSAYHTLFSTFLPDEAVMDTSCNGLSFCVFRQLSSLFWPLMWKQLFCPDYNECFTTPDSCWSTAS